MTHLIDFLCVGPQRTGTSWLDAVLRQHPEIGLPQRVKETFFWDKRYERGEGWYGRHFPKDTSGKRLGEIAPTLFPIETARTRIQRAAPGCRILVCLRDPVERAISHYRHELALGLQRGSLREAVDRDPRILEASRYTQHLSAWEDAFGDDGVLRLYQQDIRENTPQTLNRICCFLGIDPQFHFRPETKTLSESVAVTRPRLARLSYRSASLLRGLGADSLVEKLKRRFPRWLYWRQKNEAFDVSEADLEFLKRELHDEIIQWASEPFTQKRHHSNR